MSKVIAFSTAVVLLAGSVALGDTPLAPAGRAFTNMQETTIGLGSAVQLLNGRQVGSVIQNLYVQNDQHAAMADGALTTQSLSANVAGIGQVSGDGAAVGVVQGLTIVGTQNHIAANWYGPKMATQSIGLQADQSLNAAGSGNASGLHRIALSADQQTGNHAGMLRQSTAVLALQSSDLAGNAGATGTADNSISVTTVQTQAAL